jgi:hypothetical protein
MSLKLTVFVKDNKEVQKEESEVPKHENSVQTLTKDNNQTQQITKVCVLLSTFDVLFRILQLIDLHDESYRTNKTIQKLPMQSQWK